MMFKVSVLCLLLAQGCVMLSVYRNEHETLGGIYDPAAPYYESRGLYDYFDKAKQAFKEIKSDAEKDYNEGKKAYEQGDADYKKIKDEIASQRHAPLPYSFTA